MNVRVYSQTFEIMMLVSICFRSSRLSCFGSVPQTASIILFLQIWRDQIVLIMNAALLKSPISDSRAFTHIAICFTPV